MANQSSNQSHESVSSIWRAVHKLESDFKGLVTNVSKRSAWSEFWSRFWRERNWAIPTAIIVLSGLAGGVSYVGGLFLDRHVQSALVPLQVDVKRIDAETQQIEGQISEIQLRQLSSDPGDPQVNAKVQNILAKAKSGKIQLSAEVITDVGERLVEAAKTYPDAWTALQVILNYRTYQKSLAVNLGPQVPATETVATHYLIPFHNALILGSMSTIGLSHAPDIAEIRSLSAPNLNASLSTGPSYLVLQAPNISLDDLYAKKIVFVDSHIIYRGGPVVLENVYFLNCTFDVAHSSTGQELATSILSPNAATQFNAKTPS